MKFGFFKNPYEKYLLPFLLVIFIINYHYYAFYQDDFKKIFNFVPFSLKQNNFEQIQEWHPYFQIYKLAKDKNNNNKRIIYVRTRIGQGPNPYLHELNIMVDYFFYPRIIRAYSLKQFKKMEIKKDDIVVADSVIYADANPKGKLRPLIFKKKDLIRVNRRKEDDYFIYFVEK